MPAPSQLIAPVAVALVAMVAIVGAGALAAAVARRRAARSAARRDAALAVWRPRVLELLDAEPGELAEPGEPGESGRPGALSAFDGLDRRAGAALERVAGELAPQVRGEAQTVLRGLLIHRGAFERARRHTRSRRAARRVAAADLLGVCADRRVLPELTVLLSDSDVAVRSAAARALGRLGQPGAVPFLLAGLGGQGGRGPVPAGDVTVALTHIGPRAVPGLRAGLALPSRQARRLAAELLGRLGALDAVDDLRAHLAADADPEAAAAAARALGRIEHPRALPDLRAALAAGRCDEVRAAAAWSLARLGDGEGASC